MSAQMMPGAMPHAMPGAMLRAWGVASEVGNTRTDGRTNGADVSKTCEQMLKLRNACGRVQIFADIENRTGRFAPAAGGRS